MLRAATEASRCLRFRVVMQYAMGFVVLWRGHPPGRHYGGESGLCRSENDSNCVNDFQTQLFNPLKKNASFGQLRLLT